MIIKRGLLLLIGLLLIAGGVSAQEATGTVNVAVPSGRYSLDVPADWTVSTAQADIDRLRFNAPYGDMLLIAPDDAALEAFLSQEPAREGMVVSLTSARLIGVPASGDFDPRAVVEPFLGGQQGVAMTTQEIAGYPAVHILEGASGRDEVNGRTYVFAGELVYLFTYAAQDTLRLEELVTIAATLTIHDFPQADLLDPAALAGRDPLPLRDGLLQVPLAEGWLAFPWDAPFAPLTSENIEGLFGSTSNPQTAVILTDGQDGLLAALYAPFEPESEEVVGDNHTHPQQAFSGDLPGLVALVTAYPYDSLFGSADYAPTNGERNQVLFRAASRLGSLLGMTSTVDSAVPGPVALRAETGSALGGDNRGLFYLLDVNQTIYVLALLGPAAGWDDAYAPLADALLAGLQVASPEVVEDVTVGLQVGQRAPDFTLPLLGGGQANLIDYRGQIVLLNFWATWCEPCRTEMPAFQQVYAARGGDVIILAVDYLETPEQVQGFVDEFGLTFPIALDALGEVNGRYDVYGWPLTYLIDRQGIIQAISPFGPLTQEEVESLLAAE